MSCKLQITDLSYYERFHSPGVSKCSGRVTHLRGQILEILWKGQAHKCYNRKFVSKAHPLPAASPTAHTTTGTLQMSHSPTISSTIWEITTVPKVLKKKKNPEKLWPLLFDHDVRCFHVQVDSSWCLSPSTDSEVVTALGWGCVHVTELRRGQVVCLEDGGTLQLLSQVPGLEDKKKSPVKMQMLCSV